MSAHPRERKKAGIDPGQNRNKRTKHPSCSPGTCGQATCEAAPADQPRQSKCETCASHCQRCPNSRQALFQNYELAYVKGQSGQNYFQLLQTSMLNYFNRKINVISPRLKLLFSSLSNVPSRTLLDFSSPSLNTQTPRLPDTQSSWEKAEASLPVKYQVKEDKTPTPLFPRLQSIPPLPLLSP